MTPDDELKRDEDSDTDVFITQSRPVESIYINSFRSELIESIHINSARNGSFCSLSTPHDLYHGEPFSLKDD